MSEFHPLTLTFAGDESGDASFAFEKGASRFFVIAVIGTTQPDALRQLLAEVARKSNLPGDYEFRFNHMSSPILRKRVFSALVQADFESWAVIADKTTLPDSFKFMPSLDFYLYFVTEAIQLIPEIKRRKATLILDEFRVDVSIQSELRRVMKLRNLPRPFSRVLTRRSKREPLIQIADLIAGALLRRDTKEDAEAFEMIESKIKKISEYRE